MDDPIGAAHAQQLTNLATILETDARTRAVDRNIDALMEWVHRWVETGDHDARMNASEYARQLAAILQHPSTHEPRDVTHLTDNVKRRWTL